MHLFVYVVWWEISTNYGNSQHILNLIPFRHLARSYAVDIFVDVCPYHEHLIRHFIVVGDDDGDGDAAAVDVFVGVCVCYTMASSEVKRSEVSWLSSSVATNFITNAFDPLPPPQKKWEKGNTHAHEQTEYWEVLLKPLLMCSVYFIWVNQLFGFTHIYTDKCMHGTHTHTVGTDNFSFHLMILLLLVVFVVPLYCTRCCVLMYIVVLYLTQYLMVHKNTFCCRNSFRLKDDAVCCPNT